MSAKQTPNKKRKFESISNEESKKTESNNLEKNAKRLKKDQPSTKEESKHSNQNNKMKRLILWFRNDLRLHDNPILHYAATHPSKNKVVLPLYCFDPRFFTKEVKKYGTRKCGLIRTRFMIESVDNFRHNLENIDSKLLLSLQKPEDFISSLLKSIDKEGKDEFENELVYQEEICSEELNVESLLQSALKNHNVQVKKIWGSTIYHKDDLPFNPKDLPHIYGKFREKSADTPVRPLLATPTKSSLPFPQQVKSELLKSSSTYMPKLEEFGFTKEEILKEKDKRAYLDFKGGEDEGLKRLKEYVWDSKAVGNYATTRNDLIGKNYSSKMSPWLANGCISPRKVYWEVKEFEKKHRKNESTTVYIDELYWRDFNRFWCMKYGNKVFSSYGIYDREYYNWTDSKDVVQKWRDGKTGMPLIDALMRELNNTGFMPNRGRMVVACYLAMDLKQDWRQGAYYFEEKLIDHDVQSNYGGWAFSSGIGPGRVLVFNSVKQSKDHDKYGEYIKTWVPELKRVPSEYIHEPWKMPKDLQKACKTFIGEDYPEPIPCAKYTIGKESKGIEKAQKKPRAKSENISKYLKKGEVK